MEAIRARGRPVSPSERARTPWIVGRPRRGPLAGKVALTFDRDVEARGRQPGRLDVKAAVGHVEPEDAGPEGPTRALEREAPLDRGDAVVQRQEGRDVAAGEEPGHRASRRRIVA
jgi:hypothetical protein